MEFFRTVPIKTTEKGIQENVQFHQLEKINEDLFCLEEIDARSCKAATIWGEFTLTKDHINGGVRLTLQDCPNALSWTITTGYNPAPDEIVIHATINRTRKKPVFVEELYDFLNDTEEALKKW